MSKKLNILLLSDCNFEADIGYDYTQELSNPEWIGEKKLYKTLVELGHDVRLLGLYNKIDPLLAEIKDNRPDLVFNFADVFNFNSHLDKNIAALLELLNLPFTGASPDTLMICNNKGINKKIFTYHKISIPLFQTFYKGQKTKPWKRLKMPCVVKPLCEEASRGISQASIVDTTEALLDRIAFIHDSIGDHAIVEEYIEGREFYVSIFGHKRLTTLPLREMSFGSMPKDEPRIATYKAKWDKEYRKKWNIDNIPARNLDPQLERKAQELCKRAYRALNMSSYARFDIRITPEGKIYIIEPNANPSLLPDDEFALAARKAGISYETLIQRFINLALEGSE